jgi:hypothetical protein
MIKGKGKKQDLPLFIFFFLILFRRKCGRPPYSANGKIYFIKKEKMLAVKGKNKQKGLLVGKPAQPAQQALSIF